MKSKLKNYPQNPNRSLKYPRSQNKLQLARKNVQRKVKKNAQNRKLAKGKVRKVPTSPSVVRLATRSEKMLKMEPKIKFRNWL